MFVKLPCVFFFYCYKGKFYHPVILTTHPAFEHRAWPAGQEGLLALQRFGISYNHL